MEGCAGADRALDMNLARVFLNDAIGDRQTKPCAAPVSGLGSGLGGEERVIDAFQVLRRNAGTGVAHLGLDVAVDQGGHAQLAATGHRFLGVQQQVEKNLLQFAGVAMDGGEILRQIQIDDDLCRLELMFKERERVLYNLVEVCIAELGGRSSGKV